MGVFREKCLASVGVINAGLNNGPGHHPGLFSHSSIKSDFAKNAFMYAGGMFIVADRLSYFD